MDIIDRMLVEACEYYCHQFSQLTLKGNGLGFEVLGRRRGLRTSPRYGPFQQVLQGLKAFNMQ